MMLAGDVSLVDVDLGLADDRPPFVDVGFEERAEFRRRRADHARAELSARSFTIGWPRAAIVSAWSFLTILGGVLAGMKKPIQEEMSKSGTPASAMVGSSRPHGARVWGVVTASARILPGPAPAAG